MMVRIAAVPIVALALALSCSGTLPWLRGDLANHPAALVGEWVDVAKSSPLDSSFWILEPDGDDEGLRITRRSGDEGPGHQSRQHYGYWFVRASSNQPAELCVTRRPSRDAPSCTAFALGVDSATRPPRRVARLAAYAGSHHVGERMLVERR